MQRLQFAKLYYGVNGYDIQPSETLPLPRKFDFDNPEKCARLIFALMSQASGGFTLRDCRVHINAEVEMASLVANGAHIFYAPDNRPKLTASQAMDLIVHRKTLTLGSVTTDTAPKAYTRAHWRV